MRFPRCNTTSTWAHSRWDVKLRHELRPWIAKTRIQVWLCVLLLNLSSHTFVQSHLSDSGGTGRDREWAGEGEEGRRGIKRPGTAIEPVIWTLLTGLHVYQNFGWKRSANGVTVWCTMADIVIELLSCNCHVTVLLCVVRWLSLLLSVIQCVRVLLYGVGCLTQLLCVYCVLYDVWCSCWLLYDV